MIIHLLQWTGMKKRGGTPSGLRSLFSWAVSVPLIGPAMRGFFKQGCSEKGCGAVEMEKFPLVMRKKTGAASSHGRYAQDHHTKHFRQGRNKIGPNESRVALLIDGENTSYKHMYFIESQTLWLGTVDPRRVYGDWSSRYLRGWRSILTLYGLEARHHGVVASSGKNATDIALVVDAMLLYSAGTRRFSLAATDSDYTPLVKALRSRGCFIMVLGTSTTPQALRKASSVFVEMPELDP